MFFFKKLWLKAHFNFKELHACGSRGGRLMPSNANLRIFCTFFGFSLKNKFFLKDNFCADRYMPIYWYEFKKFDRAKYNVGGCCIRRVYWPPHRFTQHLPIKKFGSAWGTRNCKIFSPATRLTRDMTRQSILAVYIVSIISILDYWPLFVHTVFFAHKIIAHTLITNMTFVLRS